MIAELDTGMREVEEFKFLPEVAVYSLGTVVWPQVLHWSLTVLILNLLTNCVNLALTFRRLMFLFSFGVFHHIFDILIKILFLD